MSALIFGCLIPFVQTFKVANVGHSTTQIWTSYPLLLQRGSQAKHAWRCDPVCQVATLLGLGALSNEAPGANLSLFLPPFPPALNVGNVLL